MACAAVVSLLGCSEKFALEYGTGPLTIAMQTPERLSALCGRPIEKSEAQAASVPLPVSTVVSTKPGTLTFSNADTQSATKQGGHAVVDVVYQPQTGAACSGTLAFDYGAEQTGQQITRTVATHGVKYELSNVVVAKK